MRRALLLTMLAACGRLGFDGVAAGTDGGDPRELADAGITGGEGAAVGCGSAFCSDPSFAGGLAEISVGNIDNIGFAYHGVTVQPDDKLVVVGISGVAGAKDLLIARLSSDGTPDPTFGSAGLVQLDAGGSDDNAVSVHLQSDGKILVGGQSGGEGLIVRLLANGSPDTAFGTNGIVHEKGQASTEVINDLAVDGSGRIVGGGQGLFSGWNLVAMRLLANGTVDTSFATNGHASVDLGGDDFGSFGAFDASGRVILFGDDYQAATEFDGAIAGLTAAGVLDPTFGTAGSGSTLTDYGHGEDRYYCLDTDAQGRFVIGGMAHGPNGSDDEAFVVARYSAAGVLDATFGSGGHVIVDQQPLQEVRAIVQLPDGRIAAGGSWTASGVKQSVMIMISADGSSSTVQPLSISANANEVQSAHLDQEGRLVVFGDDDGTHERIFVQRLATP